MANFRALVLRSAGEAVSAGIESCEDSQLPEGDVVVRVSHSSLNYKDGMILGGLGKLVRTYPHVPGVDFAGIVESSASPEFKPGEAVILTGWRVGENRWGGYAERARVPASFLVKLPAAMSARDAMAIGTAGLTAMLALMALEERGLPREGEVLVTGAAGGVGSIAIALLSRLGYQATASSGRPELSDYLRGLGASAIVDREALTATATRPLASERWVGAIDSVGGATLAGALTQLRYGACIAACGNAGGVSFTASVLPLILRGVTLQGIDSVACPLPRRRAAWDRLATALPAAALDSLVTETTLEGLPEQGKAILAGRVRGRVVVRI
jgi:acrylyl-CoA reductase (NADPH)